ncbi:MAG TPA: hypothetical protein VGE47_05095, partial [Burkholderiaceae bacterium]
NDGFPEQLNLDLSACHACFELLEPTQPVRCGHMSGSRREVVCYRRDMLSAREVRDKRRHLAGFDVGSALGGDDNDGTQRRQLLGQAANSIGDFLVLSDAQVQGTLTAME